MGEKIHIRAYRDINKHTNHFNDIIISWGSETIKSLGDKFLISDNTLVNRWVEEMIKEGAKRFTMVTKSIYKDNYDDQWIHPGFYMIADESTEFKFVTKNINGDLKKNPNWKKS